jgi:16S rRNA (cytosine1402-N4)-methyltransferase
MATPIHIPAHIPVLAAEVVDHLAPRDRGIYVDGTLGACGYAEAILESADCQVYGIDRDPQAIENAQEKTKTWDGRLIPLHGCFGDMEDLLRAEAVIAVDGVTLDLGVSSMQIDQADRGFSFMRDGPLDMRMGSDGLSAADVVNQTPEAELADLIYMYGEERRSRQIARAIVTARADAPITRTLALADVVRSAFPARLRKDSKSRGIDPATRTFQALRIFINDELGELDRGLAAAERLLIPGGRLAVVSFHSLEDRRVKEFLRRRAGQTPRQSRHVPDMQAAEPENRPSFRILTRRPVTPGDREIAVNPRARSARLRAAERLDRPAMTEIRAGSGNGETQ